MSQRTVLITGAGQGMGFGLAQQLLASGHKVIVNDIDAKKAENAAIQLGGKARFCTFDVADQAAVDSAIAGLGDIDVLVNNAGNAGPMAMSQKAFIDMSAEEIETTINVNLYGVLNCCRAVIPGMVDRGWGRLITISSEAGRAGLGINVSIYGAAKAGGAHFMRHLSQELGTTGVTANVVSLGLMNNVPEEFTQHIIKGIPTRRLGTPKDVAAAVNYLMADDADWITGTTLAVNGGSSPF